MQEVIVLGGNSSGSVWLPLALCRWWLGFMSALGSLPGYLLALHEGVHLIPPLAALFGCSFFGLVLP
jgi:hypothetical protein